ncbi:hypothetical protein [uncultured Methanobrevibacter sp.]|uniref:hypothetical protein n=1 Tax=uncultured Methanobrevibacter sp. TaxID=253161 RepID=UPI0025F04D60|nr:hypothetical protein [uncultured Methanobrevibacter sp.]
MQSLIPPDQIHVGIGVTIIACHQLFIIISAFYPSIFPIILVVTFVSLVGSDCVIDYSTCS